jgi:hypothetical protein
LLASKDYLISHPRTLVSSVPIVPLPILWSVIVDGLAAIWPASRTVIDGTSLGDAWPLSILPVTAASQPWETIVPFHKLSQWLCYSLMQPMSKIMNIQFSGAELMTGLPEYRNGGLFIDTGVLTLKEEETKRGLEEFHRNAKREGKVGREVTPMFTPDDDVVVEWRAVTVGFLDLLLDKVNASLGLQGGEKLTLPQMLEAGSWKVGLLPSAASPSFWECMWWCRELFLLTDENREDEKWPRSPDPTRSVHQSQFSQMGRSFRQYIPSRHLSFAWLFFFPSISIALACFTALECSLSENMIEYEKRKKWLGKLAGYGSPISLAVE